MSFAPNVNIFVLHSVGSIQHWFKWKNFKDLPGKESIYKIGVLEIDTLKMHTHN